MTISPFALCLYAQGMEIITDHYNMVKNVHINVSSEQKKENPWHEQRYWLRSRHKNYREKMKKQQEDESKWPLALQFGSDLLLELRQNFRFGYRRSYIEQFVQTYVNSYADLLQFGRFVLEHAFANKHKWIDSPTSIEESLYSQGDWPIEQMIELNYYMYTHASTNYPCELFQPMFLRGYLSQKEAHRIKPNLEKIGLEVVVQSVKNHNEPVGILSKPWFNELVDISISDPVLENRDLYTKVLNALRASV